MQSLEQSCRKASDCFTGMADLVSSKKAKKFCYEMALDMYAAATWIENMRKVEFYFVQMFPEEYEKTIRQMQEDTEKEFEPRKGKWIEDDDATVRGHCSICGWESHYYEDDVVGANFCPNCGARME